MAIFLIIAIVLFTLLTKVRLVRMEIFPLALRLIRLLTWRSIMVIWLDLASSPHLLIRDNCRLFPLVRPYFGRGMVVSLCHHFRVSLPSVGIDHVLEETVT